MEYLHTMVRISNVEESLDFYCNKLGMVEVRRTESEVGRYTNIFLSAPGDTESAKENWSPTIELTFNWDPEQYTGGRNFGHLALIHVRKPRYRCSRRPLHLTARSQIHCGLE